MRSICYSEGKDTVKRRILPLWTGQKKNGNLLGCRPYCNIPESGVCSLLADTGLLTCKVTQVVKLGTTYLTDLVDLNAVNSR